jgi:beta-galactosidase
VPVAGNEIEFELAGAGRILGVGNGDPSCHEPDTFVTVAGTRSRPVEGWRWKKFADVYGADLPEEREQFDDSAWPAMEAGAEEGTLAHDDRGIFRARFHVAAEDLDARVVELWFGRIGGGVGVYVNGHPLGGGVDAGAPSVFDVKAILHPGENTVAVAAANWSSGTSGISRGVALHLQGDPPAPHWRRSVFNGLAQVIVQSSREPGALRLTARSAGLEPATVELEALAATPRPSVP